MTVHRCDWPGHSWPIGHYWILGCLLQSTLVGLKSSQSHKTGYCVFLATFAKITVITTTTSQIRASKVLLSQSTLLRQGSWHPRGGWWRCPLDPQVAASWSGVAWTWVTFLWDFPTWIFNPFSDLKVFRHWSHLKIFSRSAVSASSSEISWWGSFSRRSKFFPQTLLSFLHFVSQLMGLVSSSSSWLGQSCEMSNFLHRSILSKWIYPKEKHLNHNEFSTKNA